MIGAQVGQSRHRTPVPTPPPSGAVESPNNTSVTAAGPVIDASRVIGSASTGPFDTFALTGPGGFIIFNGVTDTVNSANVIQLFYTGHKTYQQNSAFNWWAWSGTAWVPTAAPAGAGESPAGTSVTVAGQTINASRTIGSASNGPFDTFALTAPGGFIIRNGVADTVNTANVVKLFYTGHQTFQQNAGLNWWGWNGTAWTPTSDPTVAPPLPPPSTGIFTVSNGLVIGPNARPFVAKGINIADFEMAQTLTSAAGGPMTQLFAGINMVRVACYSYQPPSAYAQFVNWFTGLGNVVLLENHQNFNADGSSAGNGGGANGVFFTNQNNLLQPETAWYTALAQAFGNNPLVWFGTNNEPPGPNTGQPLSGLSTWQQSTYNTIRNNGAPNNIILLELAGGGGLTIGWFGANGGMTPSVYAPMRNVVWDWHQYGWMFTNPQGGQAQTAVVAQSDIQSQQLGGVALLQQITSADGIIPVIGGECGDSTTGSPIDTSGQAVVNATIANVRNTAGALFGALFWEWNSAPAPGDRLVTNGALTSPYGTSVAALCARTF